MSPLWVDSSYVRPWWQQYDNAPEGEWQALVFYSDLCEQYRHDNVLGMSGWYAIRHRSNLVPWGDRAMVDALSHAANAAYRRKVNWMNERLVINQHDLWALVRNRRSKDKHAKHWSTVQLCRAAMVYENQTTAYYWRWMARRILAPLTYRPKCLACKTRYDSDALTHEEKWTWWHARDVCSEKCYRRYQRTLRGREWARFQAIRRDREWLRNGERMLRDIRRVLKRPASKGPYPAV